MKLLLETGVQDDIECEYCGYESALHDYESRAEFEPENFKYDGGYTIHKECPICGWSEYEDYRPTEEEEDNWPDDLYDPHLEYEPDKKQAVIAGKIVDMMDKVFESSDEAYDTMVNYIWDSHNPEDPKIHNIQAFRTRLVDYIFTRTR